MSRRRYFLFFTIFLLSFVFGCKGKKAKFPPPFFVPEEIKIDYEDGEEIKENDKVIAKIYFDNTLSQIGYFQDKNYNFRSADSEDMSSKFFRVITIKAPAIRYKPLFYILKEKEEGGESFLNWTNIEMTEMTPFKKDFYTISGSFKDREHGPLFLIYDKDEDESKNMIDVNNLTIIVSDLEEQGLNMTLLSSRLRAKLKANDDYVAAVIATKLPFNGDNYRPGSLNRMVHDKIRGVKSLYAIVAGPQESVRTYIEDVKKLWPQEENGKINWYLATTVQKWNKPLLNISRTSKEISIPEPASKKNVTELIKNGKKIKDSCEECSLYIWNLKDRTHDMTKFLRLRKEDKELTNFLKVRLFEYEKAKKRKDGDNDRWRLNVNFQLPEGCVPKDLDVKIDNYRYLVKVEKECDDSEKVDNKKKKKDKVEVWEWQSNKTYIATDFIINKVEMTRDGYAQVAICQGDNEGLKSSVVCFDLLVRVNQEIGLPEWIKNFDNTAPENLKTQHDKTPDFSIFMQDLLKGEGCGEYSRGTLIKMPIMLFNVPSYEN